MENDINQEEEIIEIISPSSQSQDKNPYIVPASIVIAGVLIAGAVLYSGRSGSDAIALKNAANGAGAVAAALPQDLAGSAPFLGSPQAPVTIVEFADFQCPYCGKFFQTVEPQIMDQYVKTGKVKFAYRNFSFLGPESESAAAAASCANEQGKFWEYHDYLFSHQQGENEGAFAISNLKKFARAVPGIDGQKFDACVDQNRYLNAVRDDTAAGKTYGVTGTPATFVNGRFVQGAIPWEDYQDTGRILPGFHTIIEQELKKSSK